MSLRVQYHQMQLYLMVANHQSNDAKSAIFRSSLMTTMTTMNLQAIAASGHYDNHGHIYVYNTLWLLHPPWVSTKSTRNTMIVDLTMTGCYPGCDFQMRIEPISYHFVVVVHCKLQFVTQLWNQLVATEVMNPCQMFVLQIFGRVQSWFFLGWLLLIFPDLSDFYWCKTRQIVPFSWRSMTVHHMPVIRTKWRCSTTCWCLSSGSHCTGDPSRSHTVDVILDKRCSLFIVHTKHETEDSTNFTHMN